MGVRGSKAYLGHEKPAQSNQKLPEGMEGNNGCIQWLFLHSERRGPVRLSPEVGMQRPNVAVQMAEAEGERLAPPLTSIFLVFLKIGAFAFGGVYSMLSFFQRELVDRRKWLTNEEFTEGVAIGQMTPGPPIVNTGVFVGYHLRGTRGAIAATAGQVLPGFLLVLVLAVLYGEFKSAPLLSGALKGIGAAVVGLLGSVVLKMGKQVVNGTGAALIALAGFGLLAFAHANPMLLIALSGLVGYLLYGRNR